MADATVATGFGITVAFSSGFFAEIIGVKPPASKRNSIDTSHTATAGGDRTFMPGDLIDNGELQVDIHFNPGTSPPIDQPEETVTLTFSSGTTWVFTGFMTDYEPDAPMEDKMVASVTIKVDGAITITPAA